MEQWLHLVLGLFLALGLEILSLLSRELLPYFASPAWPSQERNRSARIEGRGRRGPQRTRWLEGVPDSREFEQAPGYSEGQGGLVCCSPWGRKELDTAEGQS